MQIDDFDYYYPKELIAKYPIKERDESNIVIVDRKSKDFEFSRFKEIHNYLQRGDLLVINETRVKKARLFCENGNGKRVELLVLQILDKNKKSEVTVKCLGETSSIKENGPLTFKDGSFAIVKKIEAGGYFFADFFNIENFDDWLSLNGEIPIPPYLKRDYDPSIDDESYQTIFASDEGAVAAPTAALHFTERVVENLTKRGVGIAKITLHVGPGSFLPVRESQIEKHKMMEEEFYISKESADLINNTKREGGRIIPVGTTSVRSLESSCDKNKFVNSVKGKTDLFIYPGYEFKIIDGLVTNFHQPKSTLLMLVSAWTGHDLLMRVYKEAINRSFRLFSYGDSMLIY